MTKFEKEIEACYKVYKNFSPSGDGVHDLDKWRPYWEHMTHQCLRKKSRSQTIQFLEEFFTLALMSGKRKMMLTYSTSRCCLLLLSVSNRVASIPIFVKCRRDDAVYKSIVAERRKYGYKGNKWQTPQNATVGMVAKPTKSFDDSEEKEVYRVMRMETDHANKTGDGGDYNAISFVNVDEDHISFVEVDEDYGYFVEKDTDEPLVTDMLRKARKTKSPKSPKSSKKKLFAFDFDKTFLKKHTGGAFNPERLDKLIKIVSPTAKALLELMLKQGHYVAIVSYSDEHNSNGRTLGGPELIRTVLRRLYKPSIADQVYVVSRHPLCDKWRTEDNVCWEDPDFTESSKAWHIKQVTKAIKEDHGDVISTNQITLIDDSRPNVEDAVKRGMKGMWVKGNGLSSEEWDAFMDLCSAGKRTNLPHVG